MSFLWYPFQLTGQALRWTGDVISTHKKKILGATVIGAAGVGYIAYTRLKPLYDDFQQNSKML